jgi:hypothetical protein
MATSLTFRGQFRPSQPAFRGSGRARSPPDSYSSGADADGVYTFNTSFLACRCVMMALVHDIAEADVGDITPEEHSGVTKAQKLEMEAVSDQCRSSACTSISLG